MNSMLSIEPKGVITLCKVPFESSGKHNFIFKTKEDRDTYFYGLSDTIQFTDYTYIRRDSTIKFSMDYDTLRDYNYCFYRNTEFTNDIIFAYIDDLMYINENACSGRLKTDSWQTYGYKVVQDKKSSSFVERMIVAKKNDGIGDNYITENLETGEYYVRKQDSTDINDYQETMDTSGKIYYIRKDPYIVVGTSEAITGFTYFADGENLGKTYNGVYSGLFYLVFDNALDVDRYIQVIDKMGKGEAIHTIFMLPSKTPVAESYRVTEYDGIFVSYRTINASKLGAEQSQIVISPLDNLSFGGYTPKNNKLYTYPFSYILCDNNSGNSVIYKYEWFAKPTSPKWRVDASLSQGGSIKLTPMDYKGISNNWSESLDFMKMPTCAWTNDVYTNWLTQTAVSRANTRDYVGDMSNLAMSQYGYGVFKDVVGGLASVVTGNVGGGVNRLLNIGDRSIGMEQTQRGYEEQINQVVASEYEHSLIPRSVSNANNNVDVNFSLGLYNITIYHMRITSDYAKIVDRYFTRYGYKVNTFMNINDCLFTRDKWNYVKTIDCQLEVDIPHANLLEIKNMFNNGVTLWHEPDVIYKYDAYNNN